MIELFSEKIGVPYPYPRYSQIIVADFIFGGMENTTRDHADRSRAARRARGARPRRRRAGLARAGAPVVRRSAHLPRLVARAGSTKASRPTSSTSGASTPRGATTPTYELLRRHRRLPDRGRGRYRRPIVVQRQYDEPIDLFDRHLYEKGGRVLHMLRHELGDEVFWRAIGHYARKHRTARSRRATWRAPSKTRPDATSTSCSTSGSRAPATPSSAGAGSGTTIARSARCGWRRSSPSRRGAAVPVPDAGALRGRRPRTRRTRQRQRGVARVRVPPAGAADAGDLRSRRRRVEVGQAGEEPRAVAAAAGGGAAGDRSRRRGARDGGLPDRRASPRWPARCATIRSGACAPPRRARWARRDGMRRATRWWRPSRTRTRASGAPSSPAGRLRRRRDRGARARRLPAPRRPELLRRGRGRGGAGTDAVAGGAGPAADAARPAVVPGRDPQPRHRGAGQVRR